MKEKTMTLTRMEGPAQLPARKRVAAYARVSMEKDAMLHSLAAQVSYYSELIQRNPKWEYAGVFADFGLTGTKEMRPEFQRMLKECREGKIDLILVKSISRFARNTLTLLNTVRELKGLGIGVYFEEQKLDSLSGDGEFMLTILASFAQEESRSVSENCKWRIRKKFEQGIPTGFGMYGYEVRNGSFAIKPEEAAVVRRIFQMYLGGKGSVKIMKLLTEEGVPAPMGSLWNASVVMEMLKNEKYAGDLLLQKFYTNNHVEKKRFHNRGELPQYFVGEDHEPIIDRETFDAVQREIARRTAQRKAAKAKRNVQEATSVTSSGTEHTPPSGNNRREAIPLTDRIYCGVCGKKFRYKVTRLGTPYAAPVWICSTFNYRGKAYCASKQIPENILKELISSVLGTVHTEDSVHHIEMHPGNRVLFVFQDGHTEERFWKDHSRKDSWNEEKRQKAAEKTRIQHQKRKEQEQ